MAATGLACGQPWRSPPGALAVTGRFPASAPAGRQPVTGAVEVTSPTAIRGVVAPGADMFVVQGGRIVATPMAQDAIGVRWELAKGEARGIPGQAVLVSCAAGGGPLPPGSYQLYARVVFTPDDGAALISFGGPWPLEVR